MLLLLFFFLSFFFFCFLTFFFFFLSFFGSIVFSEGRIDGSFLGKAVFTEGGIDGSKNVTGLSKLLAGSNIFFSKVPEHDPKNLNLPGGPQPLKFFCLG